MPDLDSLSPWDAIPFFRAPTETTYPLNGGILPVAKADPMRVAIIFSVDSGGDAVMLSTTPSPSALNGIALLINEPRLELKHAEHGVLTQVAWWAFGVQLTSSVTVIEVFLNKWPSDRALIDALTQKIDARFADGNGDNGRG